MTIQVLGIPAPQGSKKAFFNKKTGRAIVVEAVASVKPWREAIVFAARTDGSKVPGPVRVRIVFTMPKPKSSPKTRLTYPDRKPDVDKLARAVLDSLVTAGTIEDDARVIWLSATKVYPNEGLGALDVPGAVIHIDGIVHD